MKLIMVSNRLPVVIEKSEEDCRIRPSSGGLVTAVAPVMRNRGGVWVGWSGSVAEEGLDLDALLSQESVRVGYQLCHVPLTTRQRDLFYYGFSNQTIWPLFHSLDERCRFERTFWEAYQEVNAHYADCLTGSLGDEESFLWIHDYQLMLLGQELRHRGVRHKIGFFLHIPFPPLDIFLKLPWRFQLLRGLLAYDLIGFQTGRDRRNFIQCVRTLLKEAVVSGRGKTQTVTTPQERAEVGTFPISIDFDEFASRAAQPDVVRHLERLRAEMPDRFVLLGLDRLDYTKGVPNRLHAVREVLHRYPQLHRRLTMVQILVPSREAIGTYQTLKEEIDELVGEINGTFGEPGWVPVQYMFRHLSRTELLAYYRLASAAFVTPLIDGMNLVAKEYCAANLSEQGILILSEFAGSAAELQRGALLVNPYDIEGMMAAIHQAFTMSSEERRRRMRRLRQVVRRNNIQHWVDRFLRTSFGRNLDAFPAVPLYVPEEETVESAASEPVDARDEPLPASAPLPLAWNARQSELPAGP